MTNEQLREALPTIKSIANGQFAGYLIKRYGRKVGRFIKSDMDELDVLLAIKKPGDIDIEDKKWLNNEQQEDLATINYNEEVRA